MMIWVFVSVMVVSGLVATGVFLYTLGLTLASFKRVPYEQRNAGVWHRCYHCRQLRPERTACSCRLN